ncbi:hypothetical protein X797_009618 [Metarhizium robertsii]|uniref:Uncharacterized protein n=2 Tax=Metarhizium robertsii TaxID=568076 RepID=E9F9E6_METRA|nr:uncharacterized protein MAA_08895 [Metarhizium robertsii ARSEF 23]EFY95599.1 hypothetical protein MAA_08895 [Metarhizium robertsii ARSEF 23]EXU97337.1 hypothetical protein X797_009618 [Metarhizium robertsii]
MSLQQNTMESERPDPSKNYIEHLPPEIFGVIIETFYEMVAPKGRNKALVPLCSVSKNFLASAQRLLYRDPEVYSTIPSLRSGTEEILWCIKRLRLIASGIIKNKQLANYVKVISLTIDRKTRHGPVFINKGDMQCLAPMLPDLQKLANETPGRRKLLPVEDGDNIMDAFLEALCALCPNAKRIYLIMPTVLRGFPRLLRLASDLDLSPRLILSLPEPEGEVAKFATWEFCRTKGSLHFTLKLQESALFLYRDIIQGAAVYDLVSLKIIAGEQTLPDDVEDVFSTFNTHKTIKELTLSWTPQHSGNPSIYPRSSYFSLEGLQNLQRLYIKSRILEAALMGAPSGSFARMLPKSLEALYICGDCEDWQLTALRDLARGKPLPNLYSVLVDKVVGSGDLLDECCKEMASAKIGFGFTPKQSGQ